VRIKFKACARARAAAGLCRGTGREHGSPLNICIPHSVSHTRHRYTDEHETRERETLWRMHTCTYFICIYAVSSYLLTYSICWLVFIVFASRLAVRSLGRPAPPRAAPHRNLGIGGAPACGAGRRRGAVIGAVPCGVPVRGAGRGSGCGRWPRPPNARPACGPASAARDGHRITN
jgi:hypothetical protein